MSIFKSTHDLFINLILKLNPFPLKTRILHTPVAFLSLDMITETFWNSRYSEMINHELEKEKIRFLKKYDIDYSRCKE